MGKSQASIELLIVLAVLLIIFSLTVQIIYQRNDQQYYSRRQLYAKQYADQLASRINTVYQAGPGTSTTYYIPNTLQDGTNHTINIHPTQHQVEIIWQSKTSNRQYSSSLITSNITGNLSNLRGELSITNNLGSINISS